MFSRLSRPLSRARPVHLYSKPAHRPFAYPREGVFQPSANRVPYEPAPPALPEVQPTRSYGRRVISSLPRWWSFVLCGMTFYLSWKEETREFEPFLAGVEPGTSLEMELVNQLNEDLNESAAVQELRSSFFVDPETGRRFPLYQEWTAYAGLTGSERNSRYTSSVLKGFSHFPVQKVFWNERDQLLCVFVFAGPKMVDYRLPAPPAEIMLDTGVHRGALATVAVEALARVAAFVQGAEYQDNRELTLFFKDTLTPSHWYLIEASVASEEPTFGSDPPVLSATVAIIPALRATSIDELRSDDGLMIGHVAGKAPSNMADYRRVLARLCKQGAITRSLLIALQ